MNMRGSKKHDIASGVRIATTLNNAIATGSGCRVAHLRLQGSGGSLDKQAFNLAYSLFDLKGTLAKYSTAVVAMNVPSTLHWIQ